MSVTDDVMKRGKIMNRDEAEAMLDEMGMGALPPDVAKAAAELSENDLLCITSDLALREARALLKVAFNLQSRCGDCRDAQRLCDGCKKDGDVVGRFLSAVAVLTRITHAAIAPGTRITAQREARAEGRGEE